MANSRANRGSPGVRIQVQDNSAYEIIDNPNMIAGVVGFSPKGEFNKILRINNTSVQDNTLGLGYNQAKYNMGLYATRAVLNNGGYVNFVRPYGEQVVKTDKYKSDLKSDAFVVAYDRGASKSDYIEKCDESHKLGNTSLDVRHFAATRYVEDGFAGFGGKRKINTIQETIAENSNVDFYLTAGTEFNEEGKANDVRSDTNMVLFSIVNSDPTSAKRAGDRYNVTNITGGHTKYVLTCDYIPSFIVGDVIFIPSVYLDAEHMANGVGIYATVTKILDTDVTIELSAEDAANLKTGLAVGKPGFAFYCNNDDTTTGVDYLTVKTAVANRAVKKYGKFDYAIDSSIGLPKAFLPGEVLALYNSNHEMTVVRLINKVASDEAVTIDYASKTFTFEYNENKYSIFNGDTLMLKLSAGEYTVSLTALVDAIDIDNKLVTCSVDNWGSIPETTTDGIMAEYTVIPADGTYNVTADVVNINIPTNRSKVKSDLLSLDDVEIPEDCTATLEDYEFYKKGVDTVLFDRIKVTIKTTADTEDNYKLIKTICGDLIKDSIKSNDALIVSLTDSTGKSLVKNPLTIGLDESYGTKGILSEDILEHNEETDEDVKVGEYITAIIKVDSKVTTDAETTIDSIEVRCLTNDTKKVDENDILADYTAKTEYYVKDLGLAGEMTLTKVSDGTELTTGELASQLVNLTKTTDNILGALYKAGIKISSFIGEDATYYNENTDSTQLAVKVPAGTSTQYTAGDLVTFVEQKRNGATENGIFSIDDVYTIKYINTYQDIIILDAEGSIETKKAKFGTAVQWKLVDLTASKVNVWLGGKDGLTFYMLGAYGLKVAAASQLDAFIVATGAFDASKWFTFKYSTFEDGVIERTDKVLISDEVGATFSGLGLATVKYEDDTFSGNSKQMYALNPDGEAIARMYVYLNYHFNGKNYEMEGTLAPYQANGTQLYIADVAEYVLEGTGARLILNDSGVLDNFLENNAYDLSQTVVDGLLDSVTTRIAFDEHDPAILNDAIWTYSPSNNNDSATLSNAWNLFLDKDATDINMLVAAGTDISNLFMKKRELLNTTVISAMLDVCELRKDCFAIFDGVGEANIDVTLKKLIGTQGFGVKGRWGAIYDGRGVFYDAYYTMMNVEIVKSVQMAAIITANSANGIWWFPPVGEINAVVPAEWGAKELYPRTFKRPEDTDSDIARLIEIHVNPTRSNDTGLYIWGDYTMQKAATAFDQIHVAMLLAGIHKRFYHYLDRKTFQINSTNLRADITSDLQAQLDIIINSNPPGLYSGVVVCNDSNNPPEVIDANELIVELKLKPTKTSRYITLRTVVESNGSSNTQTSSISV